MEEDDNVALLARGKKGRAKKQASNRGSKGKGKDKQQNKEKDYSSQILVLSKVGTLCCCVSEEEEQEMERQTHGSFCRDRELLKELRSGVWVHSL